MTVTTVTVTASHEATATATGIATATAARRYCCGVDDTQDYVNVTATAMETVASQGTATCVI